MENDLSNYRKNYQKKGLSKKGVLENPIELFQKWFFEMEAFDSSQESNAMTIATIDSDGNPASRIVLLKKYTWEGFIFFTNYKSEKGKAIERNPNVCLSFFWSSMERQIIIKGKAEKISENLSDGYFETRPEGSKLGAWASDQSEVIPSRKYLDDRLAAFGKKFKDPNIGVDLL